MSESPTIPDNNYLMRHKEVKLIDATGGPGAVKAAYSSGKPAWAWAQGTRRFIWKRRRSWTWR